MDRIAIESFINFPRCILEGFTAGIRFDAAMEAYEQARKERLLKMQNNTPVFYQGEWISKAEHKNLTNWHFKKD